jgi:hypothetical protein
LLAMSTRAKRAKPLEIHQLVREPSPSVGCDHVRCPRAPRAGA